MTVETLSTMIEKQSDGKYTVVYPRGVRMTNLGLRTALLYAEHKVIASEDVVKDLIDRLEGDGS